MHILSWKRASRQNGVICHLSSGQMAPPRLFYLFTHLHLPSDSFPSLIFFLLRFSSLTLPTSAFSSVHVVGSVLLNFLRKVYTSQNSTQPRTPTSAKHQQDHGPKERFQRMHNRGDEHPGVFDRKNSEDSRRFILTSAKWRDAGNIWKHFIILTEWKNPTPQPQTFHPSPHGCLMPWLFRPQSHHKAEDAHQTHCLDNARDTNNTKGLR